MKEALSSSETSVLTRATRPNIPEDTILHSHRRENLKSYIPSIYLLMVPLNLAWMERIVLIIAYSPLYLVLMASHISSMFIIDCQLGFIGAFTSWSACIVSKLTFIQALNYSCSAVLTALISVSRIPGLPWSAASIGS
jgi:hypothetical protein